MSNMLLPDVSAAQLTEALQHCAKEKIHLIGSIQPNGVMLAIDRDSLLVTAASHNIGELFRQSAAELMGQPASNVFTSGQVAWLQQVPTDSLNNGGVPWPVQIVDAGMTKRHDAQVFLSGNQWVIEIESQPLPEGDVFHDLFIPIRDALWKLDAETDMGRYAEVAVDKVRLLTGFDRVMMYRFDENWDGEVIAESRIDDAASYLGHRFPASDIPPQARALYTRNLVRLISDVDAEAVPLVSTQDAPGPLDLSHAWLRSLSPVHIEYLRNMGVKASLSISLVDNERLWGLIACHHFSPRYVNLRHRELSEFIGRAVSLKLMNMDREAREVLSTNVRDLLYELTSLIHCSSDLDQVIHHVKDRLLKLVRAEGAVVSIDGVLHCVGETPALEDIRGLVAYLSTKAPQPVFSSDDLAGVLLSESHLRTALASQTSGIMIAPLTAEMQNFVLWFRPGLLKTVRWAGNPQKQIVRDGAELRISPRLSFDTWIETYQTRCLQWSAAEIDAANALSLSLIEMLAQKALKTSEAYYRLLAENSTDMIARLALSGRFTFASPACQALFGCDGETLARLQLHDVVSDKPEMIDTLFSSLMDLGATVTRILRGKTLQGSGLWIEATFKYTLGMEGQPEILMNARDISQRYNYQLALEDVHRRHSQILDAAGEGLISLDQSGHVVYINEVAARMLGHESSELVGHHACEAFCWRPENELPCPESHQCAFMLTLLDGVTRQGVQVLKIFAKQERQRVRYVCTPLMNGQLLTGCVVVFTPDSQSAHDDIYAATDVILDQALEAVMVTDASSRITSVNRAFTTVTGYVASEAIGQTPKLLKSGVHTSHFYEDLWQQLHQKHRWSGEIWNRRKNGEIYPQWGSISAILDQDGHVRNYVVVFSDISKAKQAEEKLYHLASHDMLTGLPNRMLLSEQLGKLVDRASRVNEGLAVMFIDLDHFKLINDSLGHAMGDVYLRTIAERIGRSVGEHSVLSRWGGDEFVLVQAHLGEHLAALQTIEQIMQSLSEPIYLSGHELIATASIGIAFFPEDGRRSSDLIRAADTAMYRAKAKGRNAFECYTADMAEGLDQKLSLRSELRHALQGSQFFLKYQPQVVPADGSLSGVEALIRWQHPERGVIPPAEFLPVLEEMGLMAELTRWIIETVCQQIQRWDRAGIFVPQVAINVPPVLLQDSLVSQLSSQLAHSGVSAARLEIEITEGALGTGEIAGRVTRALRELGVGLSIDDFGTGYSSLSHLKYFPITCFKIDKSFIDGIPHDKDDVAIVLTILALGRIFDVHVVAEGVEHQLQADFLQDSGVTSIQGYYFAQPMTEAELTNWMQGRQSLHH